MTRIGQSLLTYLHRMLADRRYPFDALPPAGVVPAGVAFFYLGSVLPDDCPRCVSQALFFLLAAGMLLGFELVTHFSAARWRGYVHALLFTFLIIAIPPPELLSPVLFGRPVTLLFGTIYLFSLYGVRAGGIFLGLAFLAFVTLGSTVSSMPPLLEGIGGFVLLSIVGVATGHIFATGRANQRLIESGRTRETALRELDGFKRELMATVSHEFATPLTPILGYAHLLETRADQLSADQVRAMGREIGGAARTLNRLVDDLLDFARLETLESK